METGVIGNSELEVAAVGEIVAKNDFYDYKAKYSDDVGTELVIPARLPKEICQEIKNLAKMAYKAIDCEGYARIDFFIEKGTDRLYINEINTIPGFTKYSICLLYTSNVYKRQEWKEQIELCQGKEAMDLFAEEIDETGAKWYRFELEKSCPKHLDTFRVLIDRYQHYVLGVNNDQYFIGIPGRFILEEQPDQGSSGFKLWQPLKGAEKLYTYIEDLSDEEKHDIFGYWIAGIDKINGDFFPV